MDQPVYDETQVINAAVMLFWFVRRSAGHKETRQETYEEFMCRGIGLQEVYKREAWSIILEYYNGRGPVMPAISEPQDA